MSFVRIVDKKSAEVNCKIKSKAKYELLKTIAKIFFDETGEVFQVEWLDKEENMQRINERMGMRFPTALPRPDYKTLTYLTTVELLNRKEEVRQGIRNQAHNNEVLLELATRVDNLETQMRTQ